METQSTLHINHPCSSKTLVIDLKTGEGLEEYAQLMQKMAEITDGIRAKSQAAQRRLEPNIPPARSRRPKLKLVQNPDINERVKSKIIERLITIQSAQQTQATEPDQTKSTPPKRGIGQQYVWPGLENYDVLAA